MNTIFKVNGKPFFPLGGQATNSAAYSAEELETFWKALEAMKGNTGEIPIYWHRIEPEEGKYDFSLIDMLIQKAREKNFRLILLWFATWKNGTMSYAPDWVKRDKNRFQRVITHDGCPLSVLSSHCPSNFEADSRAFSAVMEYIRKIDETERTVIAMQVENEPGTVGRSIRDHGPDAEREFSDQVPLPLMEAIRANPSSGLHSLWKKLGAKSQGCWPEVFGPEASELFTAWSVAKYIGGIAAAGKQKYPLPMYANVWLDGGGWDQPGLNYPSGGAVPKTLDIWKWTAPALDIIAPDIYKGNSAEYCRYCTAYGRADNPLFIPESDGRRGLNNDVNMFYALGKYNAIGYFSFGIENCILEDGTVNPNSASLFGSFGAVSAALPLLIKYSNTGKIHSVVQEEQMAEQMLDFEGYKGLVSFGYERTDFYHRRPGVVRERGRGLVIQAEKDEFYVLGGGFTISFRRKDETVDYSEDQPARSRNYITVEEGYFDGNGSWVCKRVRSGDERDSGIWLYTDVGVVKVVICD